MLSKNNLLVLSQIRGVTPAALRTIIRYLAEKQVSFSDSDADVIDLLVNIKRFNPRLKFEIPCKDDVHAATFESNRAQEVLKRQGIDVIGMFDNQYPDLLKKITMPPVLLYVKGDISILRMPTVAIVGTREPSAHAVEMAPRLVKHIVNAGLVVVSGLALGCDTIGHRESVEAKSPTIAVLGGGLHNIYPKENRKLSDKIMETGGLLLSELPYGQEPQRNSFINRDRIQSGLSYGVIVLETGVKGGTQHTAKFANEQGRLVGCMYSQGAAGYDDHEKFQGNKALVSSGQAVPLEKKEQLLNFINQIKDRHQASIEYATENMNNLDGTIVGLPSTGKNTVGQLTIF
jgi:DNA processing protein